MNHAPSQFDPTVDTGEFNRLLREFARGIVRPESEQIQVGLCAALKKLAGFVGCDIAGLVSFSEPSTAGRIIGVAYGPRLAVSGKLPAFECPWVFGELAQGDVLRLGDLAALPSVAAKDRSTCANYGIHSLYGIPLFDNSRLVGGLVLGASQPDREIAAQSIERAQILGEILAGDVLQAQREARLSDAIDAAEAGLWSLDYSSMIFWATESARFMHGFNTTELISLDKVLAMVHTDDRDLIRRTIEQSSITPREMRVEYRVMLADGGMRWLVARGRSYGDTSGKPIQLLGVCADVTERKHAEEELRNARALTDAVFDSVPGLLYLYSEDGRLLRWNKQHEKMTGYSAQELLNFPVTGWFKEEEHSRLQQEWTKVFSQGQTKTELNLKLKDGTYSPFTFTGVRVEIDGKPHLVGIGMDITDRRRTEASMAQLRSELAHATRVTTLGELVSALAHELNQPLAAILSNAQAVRRMLAMPQPDFVEIREAVEDIVRDDKRAGEIVHGLRGLMTKEHAKLARLDMNRLVHGVADLLRGELVSSDVSLVLELSPDLPMIEAGKTEVQQVLLNLMLNGITAQRLKDPDARRLTISTARDAYNVIVAVHDRGIGIADEVRARLFQPFFSTKAGGLGMGLAICKRIAETYHGRIWAENNSDRGASFFLALPIAEKDNG